MEEEVERIEPKAEPKADAAEEVEVDGVVEPKTEEPRAAPKQGKPRTSRPPAGPPSDDEIKRRLARRIKVSCATEMAGEPVTVSFLVTMDGRIQSMTATPKNAAGECAKQQIMGTAFRPRSGEDTPIKVTVE